jgi:hypothetical protein
MRRQTTPRTWIGTEAQVVRHVRVCGEGHLAAATRIELERQGIHRDSDYLLPSLRPALIIACADSEADESFNDAAQQALEEGSPLLLCCLAGPVVRVGPLIEPCACFADPAWSQPAPNSTSASPLPNSPTPASHSPQPASTQPTSPQSTSAPPQPERSAGNPAKRQRRDVGQPERSAGNPAKRQRRDVGLPATPTSTSAAAPGQQPHAAHPPRRSRYSRDKADSTLNPGARLAALLVSAQALNFLLGARNQCVLDRVVELNPGSMESKGYWVFHN